MDKKEGVNVLDYQLCINFSILLRVVTYLKCFFRNNVMRNILEFFFYRDFAFH